MKVLKQTLTLFALLAVFSTAAFAQTASVNASATVQAALTVSNVSDLAFGQILATDTPTISATDAGAGAVSIENAANNAALDVTVNYPASLSDGTDNLTFANYSAAYRLDGTNDNSASTTSLGTAVGQDISGSFNSTGNTIFVYVGGQITDASAGQPGVQYSNDITVTVSYQ